MIDLTNRKIAEVLYEHIGDKNLDTFILDPVLMPTEADEELNNIIAKAVWSAGKEYFIQGYLLAKK